MNRPVVSSTPLLRTTLIWSGVATAVLAVAGGVAGYLASGTGGMWSALAAVLLAALFMGLSAATILIANRWFGDPLYVPIFFGMVMGGWILKFVVFIVVLLVLRGQPWLDGTVFFIALVASVLASLAIDVVVMLRMRVPTVDAKLPTLAEVEDGERDGSSPTGESAPRD